MATAGSLPSSPAHPTFMVVAGRLKGLLADRMGRTKEILERSTGEVSSVLADVEREMATLESLATKESKLGKPVYLGASKLAGTIKGIMEEVHKCLQQCSVKMLFSVGRPEEVKDELGETRVALQAAQEEAASLRGASAVKDEENARLRTQLGALESAKADAEAIAKRLQEEGLPAALAVVASTRRRIGELESEAAIDHDKISALTKQVEAQGADTLVLSSALQAAQAGASSLLDKLHLAREVLKANRPDIANVLDMLFAKEREVVATSREFATTAVELDSTRRELTSAKADIESKISALRDREVAVAKLSRDLEASISESASLTKDLAEARSMNSARAEEIQQVQAKLAALRSELDETTRRLAETQHDNSELQTSLASKITEAADLGEKVRGGESALDKSQAGVRALNAKVVALESDAKGLRDGIGTLEAKLTTSQSALRAFEARSHELETQLTSRTEDAARLSSQLDAEKTALAAIQAKVAEQVMGLGDAKVKITSLEARLKIQTEASTAAAEKARAEITSLSERLEAAEERDFDSRGELEMARAASVTKIEELELELAQAREVARSEKEEAAVGANCRIRGLEADLSTEQEALELANGRISEFELQAEFSTAQIERLKSEVASLKSQLDQSEATVARKESGIQELEKARIKIDETERDLRRQLVVQGDEKVALSTELASSKAALGAARSDVAGLQDQLRTERAEATEKESRLQAQLAEQAAKIVTLEAEIASNKTALVGAQSHIAELQSRLAAEQEKFRAARENAALQIEELQTRFFDLREEKGSLLQEISVLQEVATFGDKFAEQQRNIVISEKLRRQCEKSKEGLRSIKEELQLLKRELRSQALELPDDLASRGIEAVETVANSQLKQLSDQIVVLRTKCSVGEEELETLKVAAETKIAELTQQSAAARLEVSARERDLLDRLTAAEAKAAETGAELRKTKEDFGARTVEFERTKGRFEAKIAELTSGSQAFEKQLADASRQKAELEEEHRKLCAELEISPLHLSGSRYFLSETLNELVLALRRFSMAEDNCNKMLTGIGDGLDRAAKCEKDSTDLSEAKDDLEAILRYRPSLSQSDVERHEKELAEKEADLARCEGGIEEITGRRFISQNPLKGDNEQISKLLKELTGLKKEIAELQELTTKGRIDLAIYEQRRSHIEGIQDQIGKFEQLIRFSEEEAAREKKEIESMTENLTGKMLPLCVGAKERLEQTFAAFIEAESLPKLTEAVDAAVRSASVGSMTNEEASAKTRELHVLEEELDKNFRVAEAAYRKIELCRRGGLLLKTRAGLLEPAREGLQRILRTIPPQLKRLKDLATRLTMQCEATEDDGHRSKVSGWGAGLFASGSGTAVPAPVAVDPMRGYA